MERDMLKLENIQIVDCVSDWQEAVRVSVTPLVKEGYVESRYIDGIIQNTLEMGPYYIIADGVALLHGRPEQGVIHRQLGVTVLRKETDFGGENAKAKLLMVLAAEDSNSHIDVMRDLAEIFMDEKKIKKIVSAESKEEILNQFYS